jgi:membrane protein implicated in regulation of membrane protease activity
MMLSGVDPAWLWLTGGVILRIAEVVAPGFFLMFVGVAAILTGLVAFLIPGLSLLQVALFAVLAVTIARVWGRRIYARRYDLNPDPFLNNRVGRMLGQVVTVVEPVDKHRGRVQVGDSVWSARGGPAAIGERVRIVDIDGNCLKVEAEHALPPA